MHNAEEADSTINDITLDHMELTGFIFQQVCLKNTSFHQVDFTGTEFFRKTLREIDLSGCEIEGIVVSDMLTELSGTKISSNQAVQIVQMLGIKIVSLES